jgi:hypothetical protein
MSLILVCFRASDGDPDHFALLNFTLSLFLVHFSTFGNLAVRILPNPSDFW